MLQSDVIFGTLGNSPDIKRATAMGEADIGEKPTLTAVNPPS
jgi:hypothetical protein